MALQHTVHHGKPLYSQEADDNDSTSADDVDAKQRAISALSRPNPRSLDREDNLDRDNHRSFLPPPLDPLPNAPVPNRHGKGPSSSSSSSASRAKARMHPSKKFLHAPSSSSDTTFSTSRKERHERPSSTTTNTNNTNNRQRGRRSPSRKENQAEPKRYASMLPPPLKDPAQFMQQEDDEHDDDDDDDQPVKPSNFLDNYVVSEDSTTATTTTTGTAAPPSTTTSTSSTNDTITRAPSNGLSSWEHFLGTKPRPESNKSNSKSKKKPKSSTSSTDSSEEGDNVMAKLPSIQDLFPPDLSLGHTSSSKKAGAPSSSNDVSSLFPGKTNTGTQQSPRQRGRNLQTTNYDGPASSARTDDRSSSWMDRQQERKPKSTTGQQQSSASLGGVLPVSDLFYRSSSSSSQSSRGNNVADSNKKASKWDQLLKLGGNQTASGSTNKQSSKATTNSNNRANKSLPNNNKSQQHSNKGSSSKRRKMVRRGMEMLVGGVPVNADPPQRSMELVYDTKLPWYDAVAINTHDFGAFFHSGSNLTNTQLALYCEYFVHNTLRWDVCPDDLRLIAEEFLIQQDDDDEKTAPEGGRTLSTSITTLDVDNIKEALAPFKHVLGDLIGEDTDDVPLDLVDMGNSELDVKDVTFDLIGAIGKDGAPTGVVVDTNNNDNNKDAKAKTAVSPPKGFGKPSHGKNSNNKKTPRKRKATQTTQTGYEYLINMGAALSFDMGISQEELEAESGPDETPDGVLRDVLRCGIRSCVEKTLQRINDANDNKADYKMVLNDVQIEPLEMTELDDGTTNIVAMYKVLVHPSGLPSAYIRQDEFSRVARQVQRMVSDEIDEGDMSVACAAAARKETRWSAEFRERAYEEFLFQDEEEDKGYDDDREDAIEAEVISQSNADVSDDSADETSSSRSRKTENAGKQEDRSLIWNYMDESAQFAPFGGKLGHRLLEAVEKRAEKTPPKMIAIGDVHGCIEELQDLLRQCDYHPGDMVVFLGDLVSKGPDSVSVVEMANDVGALGVRGNHDFEVIRWHQAIKSGVDPPVVGSEHFHVATCLSQADVQWLYNLPWYITSKELGALFVHAGFVSGIRLAKQNPRLMMNMRSILPDGTVTSKFFNNWPWARLWDGPQTVYFGHDADRGLQQYEHAIGLDTGCVYGGRLTACLLPEKRLVSVSARREYFKYRRKHYD
ncbi:Bis(5'-nucleosyl)-tetraphosphatase PrpE [asymmetrical] [Seminavis robusta]|uniref:Bis(5'-nucleosyl)-tetraphosphatase PrpE [asymmetrical] n=1 Tax=Seminavis robusta TaxID=568900 RepID=A0A9N8H5X1_9STRA|nr:Bis(5'-nucleosyl)-tetraphosphatase PrpE [asymmetrical] [Seminavis robusta]|eukprot:Sro97_g050210.1 Bis(5'-nucleosyl)-tetraphosphatase PrpE [asymmetrical] (1178) ;mRNA; r:113752-117490